MMFDENFSTDDEPHYIIKCPYCTSYLQIDQGDPKYDDPVSCNFHGVIGTRLSVLQAVKNGDLEISEKPHHEDRPVVVHSAPLTYGQIKALVKASNHSGEPDELIIAMAWKESNFNPGGQNKHSTAGGLLGVEKTAIKELERQGKWSGGFDVYDSAENIDAGSRYLALMIQRAHGSLTQALDKYGTGYGYATDILKAAHELQKGPADPIQILKQNIHS